VEAAADEVVHAAARHRVERPHVISRSSAAQQELERRRGRELRRAPQPPHSGRSVARGSRRALAKMSSVRRLGRRPLAEERMCSTSFWPDSTPLPLLAPRAAIELQHVAERRHAVARARREVRAAENGSPPGVRKTVIGQPPLPVIATTASM
jgi:hypothetical protein